MSHPGISRSWEVLSPRYSCLSYAAIWAAKKTPHSSSESPAGLATVSRRCAFGYVAGLMLPTPPRNHRLYTGKMHHNATTLPRSDTRHYRHHHRKNHHNHLAVTLWYVSSDVVLLGTPALEAPLCTVLL